MEKKNPTILNALISLCTKISFSGIYFIFAAILKYSPHPKKKKKKKKVQKSLNQNIPTVRIFIPPLNFIFTSCNIIHLVSFNLSI